MQIILTNYGHRYITEQIKLLPSEMLKTNLSTSILLQVLNEKMIDCETTDIHQNLIEEGYLEIANNLVINEVEFRYKTNPLENIEKIVFELTTRCNFNCRHCRNAYAEKTTESDIVRLKSVADAFKALNIGRYDFIGGEVSKYGNGWLELAKDINCRNDRIITLYTNGWWLDSNNFEAAGRHYRNDHEYLSDLKQNGITHILFSIDGHEEAHDHSRNQKGLFKRIVSSFDRIKQSGINPRISALFDDKPDQPTLSALAEIATRIYDLPVNSSLQTTLGRLLYDNTNQFSSFVDIGNAVRLKKNKHKIDEIPLALLRCKAFYRPSPSLRIMANGNLSVCPLLDSGEGYGNIHTRSIVEILNNFRNAGAYKLHADNDIVHYLKYLDKNIFGEYFDHICSIRCILTLLARHINQESVLTEEKLLEINKKIAGYAGYDICRQ